MTDRNLSKELCYSKYIDMEEGNDTESICYQSLFGLLGELLDRIEKLEERLDQQEEQNEI
jgi:hypothetical protein